MEKIPSREDRMKDRNARQKNLAKTIGQNLSLYVCIMIPVLLVGLIWTETSLPTFGWGLLSDALLTVVLFVIGERAMITVGIAGGKLDDEYLATREKFHETVAKVKALGVLLLEPFCDWSIDRELIHAKRTRLRRLGIKYEQWVNEYESMTFEDLKAAFGVETAAKLIEIKHLKPIDLDPDLLLTAGYGSKQRRNVPDGAEIYIEKKRYGKVGILISALTAAFTVAVTLALTEDVTIARVLYTSVKLIALLYRMANGYNNGAKAYNTMEVRSLTAKIEYLDEYMEFLGKKLYLQIADQYPQIHLLTNAEKPVEGQENEIQSQQPAEICLDCGY